MLLLTLLLAQVLSKPWYEDFGKIASKIMLGMKYSIEAFDEKNNFSTSRVLLKMFRYSQAITRYIRDQRR